MDMSDMPDELKKMLGIDSLEDLSEDVKEMIDGKVAEKKMRELEAEAEWVDAKHAHLPLRALHDRSVYIKYLAQNKMQSLLYLLTVPVTAALGFSLSYLSVLLCVWLTKRV